MKKFIFVMPLMAVSLLASCGGSKEPTKVSYTLTYTYDNGSADKYVETYAEDKKTEKPTWVPENPGNTFEGWFTESGEEGTQFTFGNVLTNNTVIYAHWSKTPEPKTTYHLTFNGTNCKMDGTDKYEEDIPIGASTQRKIYPNEGYALPVLGKGGLVIEGEGASSVSYEDGNIKITEFSGNVVITAESKVKDCAVTFNANGGELATGAQQTLTIPYGKTFKEITGLDKQNATKTGHQFLGWAETSTDKQNISEDYVIKDDKEVYANFTPTTPVEVTFSGSSTNCTLYTADGQSATPGNKVTVPAGINTKLTILVNDSETYLPLFEDKITIAGDTSHELNLTKQEITINVAQGANCVITANAEEPRQNLEAYKWSEISQLSEMGLADSLFKVGDTKKVEVNEKDHDVRIIGFNHDELASSPLASPEYAGITFEFANLISDSNGFSLATLWNWESGTISTNENYLNSNLRKAIDGGGSQSTHLNWYQINGTKTSEEYKTSVLDMITNNPDNEELKDVLKEVRKPIAIKSGADYEVDETSYTTKLFPLSHREMTKDPSERAKDEGKTYEFYKDGGTTVKWQVNHHDGAIDSYTEIGEDDKAWKPRSYAGYNSLTEKYGGYLWLRSPSTNGSDGAWSVRDDGYLYSGRYVYSNAFAVAPAFCI